jgi:hypothetical protein
MAETKPTYELVRAWLRDRDIVKRTENDLRQARAQQVISGSELGKRMAPSDMQEGETIHCWVSTGFRQERLLSVKKGEGLSYEVGFRGDERVDPDRAGREKCGVCAAEPGKPCDESLHTF